MRRGTAGSRLAALVAAAALLSGCAAQPPVLTPGETSAHRAGVWSKLPDSPLSARRESVGAWLEDRFVLVGGWSGPPCPPNAGCVEPEDPPHRDGARFDPITAEWQRIADAPIP